MIRIHYSPEALEKLQYEKNNHPHPRVRRKMEAILLKHNGLANHKICKIIGIAPNTLTEYFRQYHEGGIEKLKEINFYQPQSELMEYQKNIADYFSIHPPATLKEARAKIEKLCGIKRSLPQIRTFLIKIGLLRRKVGSIPAKADIEKQEQFKKKL